MVSSLPRRPILGIAVAGFSADGMIVGAVRERSMAAAAGVERGDVVTRIDGRAIRSAPELRKVLASLGDHTTIETTHGHATVAVHRNECVHGTAYDQVFSGSLRLRTLMNRGERPGTAIFLQGISLSSIEDATPVEALLLSIGMTTMRFEKRGVGDSEGDVHDFVQEVEDFRAALDAATPPLILIGHSVGGMIAPLLYDERIAAIVAIGTSSRHWLSCLDESARRQAKLAGVDPEEAVRGQRDVIASGHDERSRAFHEQLDAVDLRAAWSRVRCPVLVLHGEYDWVVSEEESRELVQLVPGARLERLDGLDHALTAHATLADSRAHFGRGRVSDQPGLVIERFLRDDVRYGQPPPV